MTWKYYRFVITFLITSFSSMLLKYYHFVTTFLIISFFSMLLKYYHFVTTLVYYSVLANGTGFSLKSRTRPLRRNWDFAAFYRRWWWLWVGFYAGIAAEFWAFGALNYALTTFGAEFIEYFAQLQYPDAISVDEVCGREIGSLDNVNADRAAPVEGDDLLRFDTRGLDEKHRNTPSTRSRPKKKSTPAARAAAAAKGDEDSQCDHEQGGDDVKINKIVRYGKKTDFQEYDPSRIWARQGGLRYVNIRYMRRKYPDAPWPDDFDYGAEWEHDPLEAEVDVIESTSEEETGVPREVRIAQLMLRRHYSVPGGDSDTRTAIDQARRARHVINDLNTALARGTLRTRYGPDLADNKQQSEAADRRGREEEKGFNPPSRRQ